MLYNLKAENSNYLVKVQMKSYNIYQMLSVIIVIYCILGKAQLIAWTVEAVGVIMENLI